MQIDGNRTLENWKL